MTPEQKDFLQIVGNLSAAMFTITFIGNTIAALVYLGDRKMHIAKICGGIAAISLILVIAALTISFLSLG